MFKCTVDGKTVYQASPCAAQGKALELARGPGEQQIQEAKKRADVEQSKSWDIQARSQQRAQQSVQNTVITSMADCSGLNARRAAAFERCNAAMRTSRQDKIDRSSDVTQAEAEIRSIESQMARTGCTPE